jgi:hypothetical protein
LNIGGRVTQGKLVYRRKNQALFYPPQIPHVFFWERKFSPKVSSDKLLNWESAYDRFDCRKEAQIYSHVGA